MYQFLPKALGNFFLLKNEKSQIYPENNNFYIIPQICLQEMVVQKHVNNGHFLLVLEHYFPRNFEHCLFFKLNFYDICKTRFINLKKNNVLARSCFVSYLDFLWMSMQRCETVTLLFWKCV